MKAFSILLMFLSSFCFSQQVEEFKMVKNYYNQHRSMLNHEFKKKFDAEKNSLAKTSIKQDFLFFMKKMDSIENTALIGALLKVKNIEDLNNIRKTAKSVPSNSSQNIDQAANYPGGMNSLREHVAQLFYGEGVYTETGNIKAVVAFIVEQDGSISNVQAEGENFTFNRQAEIALYSIPNKFSPAVINGNPVRYHFRLPLTMNFD